MLPLSSFSLPSSPPILCHHPLPMSLYASSVVILSSVVTPLLCHHPLSLSSSRSFVIILSSVINPVLRFPHPTSPVIVRFLCHRTPLLPLKCASFSCHRTSLLSSSTYFNIGSYPKTVSSSSICRGQTSNFPSSLHRPLHDYAASASAPPSP